PYFRIFNPTAQGVKFDPEGTYIRRWVPELAKVAPKFIHEPWTMSSAEQQRSFCRIGHEYPAPVVDHKWARQRTLDAYKAARAG
ncbi:MAG: deoxyribodipyrimidine photo-lyase, partial [Caldilineaceae bacterium]|nr:deoxyribodipyrimidine photo-lyase [Caldilineaceae bacterium]